MPVEGERFIGDRNRIVALASAYIGEGRTQNQNDDARSFAGDPSKVTAVVDGEIRWYARWRAVPPRH
jgi:hypothetical protein